MPAWLREHDARLGYVPTTPDFFDWLTLAFGVFAVITGGWLLWLGITGAALQLAHPVQGAALFPKVVGDLVRPPSAPV